MADGLRLQPPQGHHQPTAARLLLGPGLFFYQVQPRATLHKTFRHPHPRLDPGALRQSFLRHYPPFQDSLLRPHLLDRHRPDYRNSSSSLMTTHSYIPASSTTPPTGRENNAPSLCSATIWFLSLGTPPPPPDDLGPHSLFLPTASFGGPCPRSKRPTTHHRRRHRSSRPPAARGLFEPSRTHLAPQSQPAPVRLESLC